MAELQRYHHGDLRRVLLNDAAGLLESGGLDALTLRALARRAGVSPRAPYRHFADREALLSALSTQSFEKIGTALARAGEDADTGHELEAQGIAYIRFALAAPGRFRLMFGPRRPAPDGPLGAAKQQAFAVLQARVDRLVSPTDDAHACSVGYWSLVHGLAMLLLDGAVREQLDGSDDEIIRRVAAATLRFGSQVSNDFDSAESSPGDLSR